MHRPFALLVVLVGIALAGPARRSNHVLHEKRALEPVEWVKSRRLEADFILPMRFGLAQSNLDKIEEMLASVSHPRSLTYGQHFSSAEIIDTFAPTQQTIGAVTEWLVDSGISRDRIRLAGNKGWIHVNATAAEAEELLNTEYHVYSHHSGVEQIGKFQLLTAPYSTFLVCLSFKAATTILCPLTYRNTSIS